MSQIIHLEPEAARSAARRIDLCSNEIDELSQRVRARVHSIDWHGADRDSFVRDFDALANRMRTLSEEAAYLGLRLQREVDEWECVDEEGAASLRDGLAAPKLADTIRGIFKPITNAIAENKRRIKMATEAANYMAKTPAGKDLIAEMKKLKIGMRLPDGTILGDKKGTLYDVKFKTLPGAVGQYENKKLYLDPRYLVSDKVVADTIAHEMQHAIDDKRGLLGGNLALANLSGLIGNRQKAETFIEQELNRVVASEVRAWNRGSCVTQNSSYSDDGITSQSEAQSIMNRGYEAEYERALNNNLLIGGRYKADVWVDSNGSVQVTLTPKPSVPSITSAMVRRIP